MSRMGLHSRKWRVVRIVGVIMGMAMLTVWLWPFGHGHSSAVGHCDPNQHYIVDSNGQRFLEIRWPLRSEDNLVWLRIPADYLWQGANTSCVSFFGPGYSEPGIDGPFQEGFVLQVALPDFTPEDIHKPDLRFSRGPLWTSMIISADSIVRIPENKKKDILEKMMDTSKSIYLNPENIGAKEDHITYGPKPDRFGLKRIGAIGNISRDNVRKINASLEDIYFSDHKPLDIWIKCQSEEIKDVLEDPSWGDRTPLCEQNFYSPTLDVEIKIIYRRIFLPKWRELEQKTEELMKSFSMRKADPRTY